MNHVRTPALSKVPAAALGFWVIKILATPLGETGGNTVTMTLERGYALVEAPGGEPLASAAQARVARDLRLRFADGAVAARVEER